MKRISCLFTLLSLTLLTSPMMARPATPAGMESLVEELRSHAKTIDTNFDSRYRRNRRYRIIQRFVKIGKPAIPILLKALNDDTRYGYVQRSAAEAIGKIHDPASVPPLHRLLKHGNIYQRQGAAEALGNLKSRQSVQPLIEALSRDSHDGVRMMSAIALGEIGDKAAINPLARRVAFRHEDEDVRAYSVLSLGQLQASTKIALILTVFEESHRRAYEGSGQILRGKMIAIYCERALQNITRLTHGNKQGITPYDVDHTTKEQMDEAVRSWRLWWESKGRLMYEQTPHDGP